MSEQTAVTMALVGGAIGGAIVAIVAGLWAFISEYRARRPPPPSLSQSDGDTTNG